MRRGLIMNSLKMQVDLNARITDLKYSIEKENGKITFRISFTNLYFDVIKAIKFKILAYNSFDEQIRNENEDYFIVTEQDLNVKPGQSTSSVSFKSPNDEIRRITICPFKICYSDGKIIDSETPNIVEYSVEALEENTGTTSLDSEASQLELLRKLNPKSICYPLMNEKYYICSCGYYNLINNEKCICCGFEKQELFTKCTEESISKQIEQIKIEKEKEELNQKKIAKITLIILLSLILFVIVLFTIKGFMLADDKYNEGIEYYYSGRYYESQRNFESIRYYKDSRNYLNQIEEYKIIYGSAMKDIEEGKYQNALETLAELPSNYNYSGEFIKKMEDLEILINNQWEDKDNGKEANAGWWYSASFDVKESYGLLKLYIHEKEVSPFGDRKDYTEEVNIDDFLDDGILSINSYSQDDFVMDLTTLSSGKYIKKTEYFESTFVKKY